MSAPNPYEEAARRRKVDALTDWTFQAMLRMRDLSPIEAADAAVRFCDNANTGAWEMAAKEAGVNPPSSATLAMIRARLVAQRDAMVKMPDDVFDGIGMAG